MIETSYKVTCDFEDCKSELVFKAEIDVGDDHPVYQAISRAGWLRLEVGNRVGELCKKHAQKLKKIGPR